MLAIAGEHVVVRGDRTDRADLRRLLAQRHQPEAELALPLQRERLLVEPAGEDHVPVQVAAERRGDVEGEPRIRPQCPVGSQHLDHIRLTFLE
jgi:hypothetical protein